MTNWLADALFSPHLNSQAPFIDTQGKGRMTYHAFLQMTSRYAHALNALGAVAGDRLVMQVEKSVQALAVYAACIRAGVVFVPLNTAYQAEELAYFIADAAPKLIVCDPAARVALAGIADTAGASLLTMAADGSGAFQDAAADQPLHYDNAVCGPDDLAAFLYTSGTTGRSKGAMLTHDNLLSNARALTEVWQFTADDVLLHALPIFHAHGLFVACNVTLLAGGSMIFLPRFDLEAVLAALPHATTMMGVPTFYTRLLDDARFNRGLAGHMRLFVSGSAPLLAETHATFQARTGLAILERYGMTETGMNTTNPYDAERRPGTVGFPLQGVCLRIADAETGQVVPQGAMGVIEVRGPNVFKGYWKMPEKTQAEFRDDGFFITGDIGRIDEDGYIHIVGRAKDLIITGGYNVYPKELELLLDEHPDVLEAAVIGVPHPDFGEAVVAVVVARAQRTPDAEAIRSGLSTRVAKFKQPKAVIVVGELPRNTMGKVQKNLLRDSYRDLFRTG